MDLLALYIGLYKGQGGLEPGGGYLMWSFTTDSEKLDKAKGGKMLSDCDTF